MVPSLLHKSSARIARLAAMSAKRSVGGANTTNCRCFASIRTLDNSPSSSTSNRRNYSLRKLQCLSNGNNSGESVEPSRIYKVMSPTQHTGQSFASGASPTEAHHGTASDTAAAAAMISTPSSEYEDYDLDNLEMPMSATTSMDHEDNSGCDSLGMDDVMSVREARRVLDAEFCSGADDDETGWYSDGIEGEGGDDGFVEIEEDWEALHEQVHAGDGGGDAHAEEDGDVAIDW